MSDFKKFRDAVNTKVNQMAKADELFVVAFDKDAIWDAYLSSYPEGTNPIYKERTEHDCNCCKAFVRGVGAVVSLKDGEYTSVWDINVGGTYQAVADAMAEYVRTLPIRSIYRYFQKNVGSERTLQELESGGIKKWDHFYAVLPTKFVDRDPGTVIGNANANFTVLNRSVKEITDEAVDIVIDLIDQKSIYRGEEHLHTVKKLREVKKRISKLKTDFEKTNELWATSVKLKEGGRFKNTVIGTLMVDISEGVELEKAVKAFEQKVAPSNYKRSSALITKKMIENAEKKVVELGVEDCLHRRYATVEDISVNNVLFANRDTKPAMRGGVFEDLKPTAKAAKPKVDKVEEISVDDFINKVLPKAEALEVFVENQHTANMVSLIAPVFDTKERIFKWDNNFSWTYTGDVTDSLRDKVQAAGGRVDGVLRFSHSWNYQGRNASLMDLHVFMPESNKNFTNATNDIYGNDQRVGWNNRKHDRSGGVQDVDYVKPAPEGYIPVENITFPDKKKLPDGDYECMIHNWKLRSPTNSGFKAEIEFGGQVFEYEVTRPLKHKEWVKVATVNLNNGVFSIKHHLPCGSQSREVWGVSTENFQKVKMVMNSPNHWDDQGVGNRHVFFMLDDCVNPEKGRGFYNEYLRNDLNEHRKVFEVLGARMKAEESENQLSGIGFSTTQRASVLCRVTGSFNRVLKVNF